MANLGSWFITLSDSASVCIGQKQFGSQMLFESCFEYITNRHFFFKASYNSKGYVCHLLISSEIIWTSLVAQRLKHLPAMWETWVQSLGREDPLEKEMAVFLPGKSHRQRTLVGCSSQGRKELDTTEWLHFLFFWKSSRCYLLQPRALCYKHKLVFPVRGMQWFILIFEEWYFLVNVW